MYRSIGLLLALHGPLLERMSVDAMLIRYSLRDGREERLRSEQDAEGNDHLHIPISGEAATHPYIYVPVRNTKCGSFAGRTTCPYLRPGQGSHHNTTNEQGEGVRA
jgi:hypothetical protein